MNIFYKTSLFFILSSIFLYAEQLTDDFRLDGYANISFREKESLADRFNPSAGLQGRYQLTGNISITGQIHFEEGKNSNKDSNSLEDYDSDLKWLYVDYSFENDIIFRVGAFQFPVFKSSETGDIGYTYTWTGNPLWYYGVFGCDDFEGAEVLKNFSYEDFDFLTQISYGKSKNELNNGRDGNQEGEVDNLIGLTLKTSHDYFILNIGYLQATADIGFDNTPAQMASYINFDMYAVESEIYIDDFAIKSGLIKTNLSEQFPENINYYSSLEYTFSDFTPYILYSEEITEFKFPTNQNMPNPNQMMALTKKVNREKYAIGLRYDYSSNIAFKTSYTHEIQKEIFSDNFKNRVNTSDTFMGTINVIF